MDDSIVLGTMLASSVVLGSVLSFIILHSKGHVKSNNPVLDFDEWADIHAADIDAELAESGADREMDFDSEREYLKRYEVYIWKSTQNVSQ